MAGRAVPVTLTDEIGSNRENHGLPEKDRPIMWAAIDTDATHRITGDFSDFGHLMGKSVEGVEIVSPTAFITQETHRSEHRGRSE